MRKWKWWLVLGLGIVAVCIAAINWLNKYQSIAIWLEGIALVAIFVWDRLDSRKQHEETLAQLRVAQRQVDASLENANAAKLAAESVVNSERAWVMAELSWYDNVHVVTGASQIRDEPRVETTHVKLKLTCRNEGRTPAWIDQVYRHLEIFKGPAMLGSKTKSDCQTSGPMGPLGAGKEQSRVLEATCSGHPKADEYLAVYAVIEYRDIFGLRRDTVLGYGIDSHGGIYRQDALPERNRNTDSTPMLAGTARKRKDNSAGNYEGIGAYPNYYERSFLSQSHIQSCMYPEYPLSNSQRKKLSPGATPGVFRILSLHVSRAVLV